MTTAPRPVLARRFQALFIPAALFLSATIAHAQTQPGQAQPGQTQPAETPPAPPANLYDMPSWSEFPVPPSNVPTPQDIRQRVRDTNEKRQTLRAEIRALVWDNANPDAFAANAFSRIDPSFANAVEKPMSVADIEKLASDLRRRAAPPPIAD